MVEQADFLVSAVVDELRCLTWDQVFSEQQLALFDELVKTLEFHKDEIALTELEDTGKTDSAVVDEISVLIEHFKYAFELMNKEESKIGSEDDAGSHTRLFPIGNVGLILPYNFPAVVLAERLPYMLAAGNAVCVKPSEIAEGSVGLIVDLVRRVLGSERCSILRGGGEVGNKLVKSQKINFVSFTGSSRVGKVVAVACAERFKRYSLELGGLNFAVIQREADFDAALQHCVKAITYHSGQCCISLRRVLVPKGLGKRFEKLLTAALHQHLSTNPLTLLRKRREFDNYLSMFDADLTSIQTSGQHESVMIGSLSQFPDDAEVFGPLIGIGEFQDEDDAKRQINSVEYGLALQLFSTDVQWVNSIINSVGVGRIWVNDSLRSFPWLRIGGFKRSGNSWIGGKYALLDYMASKAIVYGTGLKDERDQ